MVQCRPRPKRQGEPIRKGTPSSSRRIRRTGETSSSDLAALGHLPKGEGSWCNAARAPNGRVSPSAREHPPPADASGGQGKRPHPTSLRSATFPNGGRLRLAVPPRTPANPDTHPIRPHRKRAADALSAALFSDSLRLSGRAVSIAECCAFCPETLFFFVFGEGAGLPPRPAQGLTPPLHPRKGHRPLTLFRFAFPWGWFILSACPWQTDPRPPR